MAETEKVEIMNFDQEGYLEDGKALVETGKKMAAMATRLPTRATTRSSSWASAAPGMSSCSSSTS